MKKMRVSLIIAAGLLAAVMSAAGFAGDAEGTADVNTRLAALEKLCREQQETIKKQEEELGRLRESVRDIEEILRVDAEGPHDNVIDELEYDVSNLKTGLYQLRSVIR